ncbi:MAG: uroporphyrinogen-III synthase [Halieaceae bacterium]|jgi:uroporphyrinogen-III synthase
MSAEPRALLTRPAGQADALREGLQTCGFDSLHVPMLTIEPIDPLPAEQRQRVIDLDLYEDLIFISANAARMGLACFEDFWPQYPAGQRYWAVGRSTAQVLDAAGLLAHSPADDMSSEGLLAMRGLASVAGRRLLIVKGEGGRDLIQETLRERGARVDTLRCYRRTPTTLESAACHALLQRQPVQLILISSGEGLRILSGLLQPRENTNLAATALVVPSARVAEEALRLGWLSIEQAANASDSAMLAAAQIWRASHLGEANH